MSCGATPEILDFSRVVGIVDAGFVLSEIDDQRHAAVGHEALFGMGLRVNSVVSDRFDEPREGWTGSEDKEIHNGNYRTEESRRQRGHAGQRQRATWQCDRI